MLGSHHDVGGWFQPLKEVRGATTLPSSAMSRCSTRGGGGGERGDTTAALRQAGT